MIKKAAKYSLPFTIALAVLALTVGVATFFKHVQEQRDEIQNTFKSRNEIVRKFIDLQLDRVNVMSNLMHRSYVSGYNADNRLAFEFHEYPEFNTWELTTRSLSMAGLLTGNTELPLTDDVSREVQAAISLDSQINATLKFDSDIVWIYYQSARNFIYLAPYVSSNKFHYSTNIYKQPYWLNSLPNVNKERRMIIADPYLDEAGKGWIVTFAEPVYYKDTFLGITALDLSVSILNKLIGVGHAAGKSLLLSENSKLITNQTGFNAENILGPLIKNKLIHWHDDKQGNLWLSNPVVKDELWLVHQVSKKELYLAAARESTATWLMILMLALVSSLGWKLKNALEEVTRITHIDPLTQALNRRGFYEQFTNVVALARRKSQSIAILIMDIDYFKKINDQYGHAVGDSVLKQLGTYLIACKRPTDLICRWGGEEFVIVIALDKNDKPLNAAERIREEAQRSKIDMTDTYITLSGGLVVLQEGEDIDSAIKRADLMLYQAKKNGRNQIVSDIGG